MILGLRLPAPESRVWVWAGRLCLLVAGTAAAWLLLLTVSGQARAASPADLPCVASSAPGASHRPPVDDDSVDVPPAPVDCASAPLSSEQPAPAAVAAGAGRPGIAGPPIAVDDLLPLPALDQQTRRDSAGPAGPTGGIGNNGHAVVGAPTAAGNDAEPGSGGCAGTTGCAGDVDPARADPARAEVLKAPSGQSLALSRPAADGAEVLATHGLRADADVVARPGVQSASAFGWVQRSGSAPAIAGVRPSTASPSPGGDGLPPLPLPESPGPCAGASMTSASGSGGSDRFDALAVLGSPHHRVLPPGSTGIAPSSDHNSIRAQARPEPRPD